MINAEYLDHLDRVSEGLPGPFSARHGIGHIFALTQKSLLDHGLDSRQADALLNRLLPANLVHPWVQTAAYRTRYAAADQARRVMVFAALADQDRDQSAIYEAFQKDVEAIRDLLAGIGVIAPTPKEQEESGHSLRHPSRYKPSGKISRTSTHTDGRGFQVDESDATITSTETGVEVSAKANGQVGSITGHFKRLFTKEKRVTHTQSQQSGSRTEHQQTQDLPQTGFENTAVILQHLRERLHLQTPDCLCQASESENLDNLAYKERRCAENQEEPPSHAVANFYHDARVTSVRLTQLAGLLLAQDVVSQGGDGKNDLNVLTAARGYTRESLSALLKVGYVDWKRRPYREMGFHLLIYAALYQSAALRVEQWVKNAYTKALQNVARTDPSKTLPSLTENEEHGQKFPGTVYRPLLPQDLAAVDAGLPMPPFPVLFQYADPEARTGAIWTFAPHAMRAVQGSGWTNPDQHFVIGTTRCDHTPDLALSSLPGCVSENGVRSSRLSEIMTIEALLETLQAEPISDPKSIARRPTTPSLSP